MEELKLKKYEHDKIDILNLILIVIGFIISPLFNLYGTVYRAYPVPALLLLLSLAIKHLKKRTKLFKLTNILFVLLSVTTVIKMSVV